jgi:hypothetical protein
VKLTTVWHFKILAKTILLLLTGGYVWGRLADFLRLGNLSTMVVAIVLGIVIYLYVARKLFGDFYHFEWR